MSFGSGYSSSDPLVVGCTVVVLTRSFVFETFFVVDLVVGLTLVYPRTRPRTLFSPLPLRYLPASLFQGL